MSLPLQPRLAWQIIDGEGVLLDVDRQRAFGLNPTATFLLSCPTPADEEVLSATLVAHFEVSQEQARTDVRAFLAELRKRGLARAE